MVFADGSSVFVREDLLRDLILNNSSTAIFIDGVNGEYDFGTAASPGSNDFLGSDFELDAVAHTASSQVIQAVGNIWDASVQGGTIQF